MIAGSRRALALGAGAHAAIVVAPALVASRAANLLRPGPALGLALLVAFSIAESKSQRQSDRSRFGAPGTYNAAVSALGLLVVAWLAMIFPGDAGLAPASTLVAATAMAAGIALRVLAIRALGHSFTSETVFVPGQRIVRDGLYRWLAHPSDVGLALVAVGLCAITMSTVASIATALVVLPSIVVRVVREDRRRPHERERHALRKVGAAAASVAAMTALMACSLAISTDGLTGGGGILPEASVESGASDAGVEGGADAGNDSGPSGARCDPDGTFTSVTPLTSLATGDDEVRPRLSDDELTIYYTRGVPGSQHDLFVARRSSRDAAFGLPQRIQELSSDSADDADPSVSSDGLVIVFATTRVAGQSDEIFYSVRATTTSPWAPPESVAFASSTAEDIHPFLANDSTAVVFASSREGDRDLYWLESGPDGPTKPPTRISELSTTAEESSPVLSGDLLTIYFASRRDGGKGDRDVWKARRATRSSPFADIKAVTELNTAADDAPGWLSLDNCRLYFARSNMSGEPRDLFVATRSR